MPSRFLKWFHNRPVMSSKLIIMAVALALVAASGGLALWAGGLGGVLSQSEPGREAVTVLSRGGGESVAVVNGQAIPESKVLAYQVLSSGLGPGPGRGEAPPFTIAEYTDLLIDNELLYQEAARRGMVPTDEEVLAAAREYQRALQDALRTGGDEVKELREFFNQVRGTDYHVDAYDKSPVMLDAFRRQIAVGRLRMSVLDAMAPSDRNDSVKRESAIADLVASLRATAIIQRRTQ